ncbi:MAG: GFA family protein [Gammaproteobacteria bacterium]|nr:GFA family protein [Gammaproteobacteria bacterium]
MNKDFTGGCLCEAVTYIDEGSPLFCGHCQCVDCRKASGTGHGSHMAMPEDSVRFSGETRCYDRPADSGNMVGRHFCPECGSAVYSTNSAMPGMVFLRASSLDDPDIFKPQLVVFTKSGAAWDLIDPELPSLEAAPPPEQMPL